MSRRGAQLVVLLLVAALVLSGVSIALAGLIGADDGSGSSDSGPFVPAPTTTPAPGAQRPPRPALAEYYEQELAWQQCGAHECTRLTVPLDYAQPGGRTIQLAVLRVPAGDPDARVGSLVVNPGGPGAPGTSYAAQAPLVLRDALRTSFDVVGFDPRGTGFSDAIDCVSDEQLDVFLAADPAPDDPAEVAALTRAQRAFHAGCREQSGPLLDHVSTVEAARDIDVLRSALGESELTYFGASYGTKLGATYAELFPERAGRLLLDGAVDPSLGSRELSLGQAGGFEVALRAYVEDCVSADDCPLGDSVDDGLERLARFLDDVDADHLPTRADRPLRAGNAFSGIVAPLYNRDYWPLLTAALSTAFEGDGTGLLQLADAYSSRGPDGFTDNSSEAILAINCLDDPTVVRPADVPAAVPAFEEASPTFGRVFAWGMVGCLGFQGRSSLPEREIRAAGAPPIVVVGTTRDPATPYAWSEALADQLVSGVLVTRDGDGHTGYNAGNDCVDEAVEGFLVEGTVPEDGLRC